MTAAPAPEFGEAGGKAAASVKVAQAAFESGNYDKAVASAQAALREDDGERAGQEDPGPGDGRPEVGRPGARGRRRARGGGDIAAAEAAAAEALADRALGDRAVALQRRIAEAKAQAQREAEGQAAAARTAQVNAALNEASSALQNKQYEAAIAAYERALALDPGNAAAQTGRQAAIGSKSLADAAASGPRTGAGPVKSFVPGRTEAKAAAGGGLVGFEDTAGITVKQGTQAAALPGTIVFDAAPQVPKAGEAFKVAVFLSNEGAAPIPLTAMTVTTTVDGKSPAGSPAAGHRHGGAGPEGPRVPDASAGVERQHAVVGDGNPAHHAAWRNVPKYAHLEVSASLR